MGGSTPKSTVGTDLLEGRERPSARRANRRGAASREGVLAASLALVGRCGLEGASLGAAAAEAGTSKATVLYHFGSREALLREVAAAALRRLEEAVYRAARRAGADGVDPAAAALEALFDPAHRPLLSAAREMMGLGQRDAAVGRAVRAGFAQLARMVALLMPEQGRGEEEVYATAQALVLAVHGHLEAWLCSGEPEPAPWREGALRAVRAIAASQQAGASRAGAVGPPRASRDGPGKAGD